MRLCSAARAILAAAYAATAHGSSRPTAEVAPAELARRHRMVTRRRPSMLERTCNARFSQAGRDALRLGGRGAFLDGLGGRTYGDGSCPSYLSMMRSYFTPC